MITLHYRYPYLSVPQINLQEKQSLNGKKGHQKKSIKLLSFITKYSRFCISILLQKKTIKKIREKNNIIHDIKKMIEIPFEKYSKNLFSNRKTRNAREISK